MMAASKLKGTLKKKLNSELDVQVRSLKEENVYLKKSLTELAHQHAQYIKLMERFLCLETRRLEGGQQLTAEREKSASEQLCKKEGKSMEVVSMRRDRSISSYSQQIEEMKNKIVSVSARCHYLENKVTGKQDSAPDEKASATTGTMTEHQNYLRDALEKNKQWLEYDQQREAYVKAILARMLWLEKQLNEASRHRSQQQQHNEDHSVEEKIRQMKEHYEGLLQKAKDELDVLREEVDKIHQNLVDTQNWCKEREKEVEELKQQLQTERLESSQEDHYYTVVEEQHLRDETNDLQERLKEERRRSANSELQANLYQRFMLNHHHAGQEEIADLKRQIKISSQDLEDEKQNCSYLKKQMVRVLKTLQKKKDPVTKQRSKRDQQDESACEVMPGPSQLSRDGWASMTHGNLMDESFLECPSCQAEYPASHYRELMNHLEICLD